MRISRLFILCAGIVLLLSVAISGERDADTSRSPVYSRYVLNSGEEYIGIQIDESAETIRIQTVSGIELDIPRNKLRSVTPLYGKILRGKWIEPDPSHSRYIISPTAYPIGKGNSYFRDLWVIFPSYNWGPTENISVLLGAGTFPGLSISEYPLIAGVKYSLPPLKKIRTAVGVQYFSFNSDFKAGFLFGTLTAGDKFTHASVSLGWGYGISDGDWEIMERPILTLSGYHRISRHGALVSENWIFPDADFVPLSLSYRFVGQKFSVDVGYVFFTDSDVTGFPLLNFAWHF